jgi:photosystem II stability/assembly factor-like uncharacterized protein
VQAEKTLYNGVVMAGKRVVAVGQYGNILYSDNKGASWTQANVPASSDLLSVHFPTPKKGWAVGHDGIVLNSSDGGVNWVKQFDGKAAAQVMFKYYTQNPPKSLKGGKEELDLFMADMKRYLEEGADKPFLDVWFENETSGFIVGTFNLIFHTTDGGKSWEPWFDRVENPERFHLYCIRAIGEDIFATGERGMVWRLDRKAARFRAVKTPYTGTLFGITGKPGVIVAFGMRGTIYRSSDKGANWKQIETGLQMGLTGGTVSEDGHIILVSQAGHVLMSNEQCQGFNLVKGAPFSAAAVVAPDRDTIVAVGFGGLRVQKLK